MYRQAWREKEGKNLRNTPMYCSCLDQAFVKTATRSSSNTDGQAERVQGR